MKLRIITGVVAAILVVLLIGKGPVELMLITVAALSAVAYLEYDRLFFGPAKPARVIRLITLIVASIGFLYWNVEMGWFSVWASFVVLAGYQVFSSSRTGDFPLATRSIALEMLGYLYVISLFGFLLPIAQLQMGREYLFLLFFIVFIGDTAAYFVGTFLGRHKLAVRLSPKKSVEGAAAAVIASLVVSFLWLRFASGRFSNDAFFWRIMAFAPLASILAQTGDLFESMFKRSQLQKDSGTLFPGHGGILDRVDGLALATPVYYYYVIWILEKVNG